MESGIPIIDVAGLRGGTPAEVRAIAAAIGAASRSIGFFLIRNHGIAPELTARLFDVAAEFFALPQDEKDQVSRSAAGRKYVGYARLAQERLNPELPADYRETLQFMREFGDDDPDWIAGRPYVERNLWPTLPGLRETVTAYSAAVTAVAIDLHRAFAIDVGTDPDAFVAHFERPLSGLGITHYPPPPEGYTGVRYGIRPHTDWGGFTLLAQDDVGGLEVRRRDGTWIPVEPIPGTLVCNIGDALMRWTNDEYVSNVHHVINRSQKSRFSAPFFFDPGGDTPIIPFAGCVSADRPAKYSPITYAEMWAARNAEVALAP
jgi:isopenicillin N synthase-like dioxygenase